MSDDDVIAEILPSGRYANPADFFRAVPEWPLWVRGRSSFKGGRLTVPSFVTRYCGSDWAIHQGIRWTRTEDDPVLADVVALHRLERLPDDEEWRWLWHPVSRDIVPLLHAESMADQLQEARRRLPELLEMLGAVPGERVN